MLIDKQQQTKKEFYKFINLPQNAARIFELIEGEIFEKMPTFGYSSGLSARLTTFIGMYLLKNNIAHMTDAQGAYEVDAKNTLAPDVGVILKSRQPELPSNSFIPIPPDFVVEVVSVSDLKDPENRIEKKLQKYRDAGLPLIWYVFYERQTVEVYRKGQPKQVYGLDDTLDGGDVLPDFTLRVRDIFGK